MAVFEHRQKEDADIEHITEHTNIIEANAIGYAFAGERCLFCGEKPKSMYSHSKTCSRMLINQKKMEEIQRNGNKHAYHSLCGSVMILQMERGLALIENEKKRFVVPVTSLHCGDIYSVVEAIERAKLSQGQAEEIIKLLANKHHIGGRPLESAVESVAAKI